MPKRKPITDDNSHERWLVSYADFVTLLFAFFVVMYSVSQVNESKYRTLSTTLMSAFSEPPRAIKPIQVGEPSVPYTDAENPNEQAIVDSPVLDEPAKEAPSVPIDSTETSDNSDLVNKATSTDEPVLSEGVQEVDRFEDIAQRIEAQFSDLIKEGVIQVASNEFWLQITLNDNILFSSAQAKPSDQANAIFSDIAQVLTDVDNPIQVEGFTDDRPINTRVFDSNWELSSARASAVVKILANNGIAPQRLSAVGYGEHQPVASNGSPEGRSQNRRVALMVAKVKQARPDVQAEALSPLEPENTIIDARRIPPSDAPLPVPSENSVPIEPVDLGNGRILFTTNPELTGEENP